MGHKLNINPEILKGGDVLHCMSNGFLPRAIRWFTKSRYNHSAKVTTIRGEKFIIDSQRDGTNPRPLRVWLEKYNYTYAVHRPFGIDLHQVKTRAMSKVGHTKYDFAALLWHQPIYQLFGVWKGRRHTADKKLYCSEYIGWVYKLDKWWKMSPQALYEAMEEDSRFYQLNHEYNV